jgi:hypothetical protein
MADLARPAERMVPSAGRRVCPPVHRMEGTSVDSERFDELVRSFGRPRSRRQTLRGLAGAAAGAFALGGREASADTCKRDGKACRKNSQCCSNTCVDASGRANAGTCRQSCVARTDDFCTADRSTCCDPGYVCGDDECGNTSVCSGTVNASCRLNSCDCLSFLVCDPSSQKCIDPLGGGGGG